MQTIAYVSSWLPLIGKGFVPCGKPFSIISVAVKGIDKFFREPFGHRFLPLALHLKIISAPQFLNQQVSMVTTWSPEYSVNRVVCIVDSASLELILCGFVRGERKR